MGVRVNKVLGYGLVDLVAERHTIMDERINPEGMLGANRWEDDFWTRDQYLDNLDDLASPFKDWADQPEGGDILYPADNIGQDAHFEKSTIEQFSPAWRPRDSVVYQGEYGMSNVLCIIPPSMTSAWSRYANSIDYIEETRIYKQTNRVEVFKDRGFHPWDFGCMDCRTGMVLDTKLQEAFCLLQAHVRRVNTNAFSMAYSYEEARDFYSSENAKFKMDDIAQQLGFLDRHECADFMVPIIPRAVHYLCHFGKIFRDESTICQLRPMLYVYWS